MTPDQMLTNYALPVCLVGLMLYMGFIVYRLAMDSKAGKWGMFVLYGGLMVGVFGFSVKFVIKTFIQSSLV